MAGDPEYGGTVVIAGLSDLENLNSLVTGERYTQEMNRYALFLPLVHYDESLDYVPALAEGMEMLGDTGVVVRIRRDVRWHDGEPTTAHDVVFTYDRARDPETAFPNAEYFARWTGAVAPDSFTVHFTFEPHEEPLAGLPFLPIMPKHLLDSIPSARMRQAAFNKRPVGNGPFRFVEYRANDRWVFEANPDFPESLGGRPWIDRLVWRVIPEATAQIAEITAGSADIILSPRAEEYADLTSRPGLRGMERTSRQYGNVMWNGRVEPLGRPDVRHALSLAIDRQQIIDGLRAGYGSLAAGPVPPNHWAFDASLQPLPYAPDSARVMLDAAGLTDSDGDGIRELPDGSPFEIELKIPASSAINRDMAEFIRGDLADVGVRIVTRPVDFATMVQDFTSTERNFEAIILAWEADFRLNLRDTFHSDAMDGQFQIASYSNPRVDALIDSVAVLRDRDAARGVYRELQEILRDEQPWSFLYYYPDLVVVRERVQGVEMDIRGSLVNVHEWWVSEPRAGAEPGDSADRSPLPDSALEQ